MARHSLTIGGTARGHRRGTLRVSLTLNGVDTLSAVLDDAAESYWPAFRAAVVLAKDGTTLFTGRNTAPAAQHIIDGSGRTHSIEANDYSGVPYDIQAFGVEIAGGTLRDIVDALMALGLTDAGLTRDPSWSDEGPTLGDVTYAAASIGEIFDGLTTATGWPWTVNADLYVQFFDPDSPPAAPWSITDLDAPIRSIKWTLNSQYANSVYGLGGTGEQTITDEAHTADGSTREFTLEVEAKEAPGYLTIDGADYKPVGINGVDDMEWTYRASDYTLVQRVTDSILTNGQVLTVSYIGVYPVIMHEEDAAEVAANGRVDYRLELPDCFDKTTLEASVTAELARRKATNKTVEFVTTEAGLFPGMAIDIERTSLALSGAHLITQVDIHDEEDDDEGTILVYTVTAEGSGLYQGSWADVWRQFASGGVSSGGGSGSVGSGSPGTTVALGFIADLGGSSSEARQFPATEWHSVRHQRKLYLRDTWFTDGLATVRAIVRNDSGGSLTLRLYNYTTTASVGESDLSSDTTETEISFIVPLTAGLNQYGLEVQAGDSTKKWWVYGTISAE